MKKKIIINVLLFSLFLIQTGCTGLNGTKVNPGYAVIDSVKLSKEAKIAKQFLQDKGYKVIAYSSKTSSSYLLTKGKLNDTEDHYESHKWQLQGVATDEYIGKTIFNERFIVKNHPLDTYPHGEGKTYVDVMVVDGNAIGGISAPYTKDALMGMPYSLEGKTLEEIKNKK